MLICDLKSRAEKAKTLTGEKHHLWIQDIRNNHFRKSIFCFTTINIIAGTFEQILALNIGFNAKGYLESHTSDEGTVTGRQLLKTKLKGSSPR